MHYLEAVTMDDFSEYIPTNEQGMRCLQGLYFNNPSNKAKQLYYYPLWTGEYCVNYPYMIDRQYMNSFIVFLIEDGELSFTFDDRRDFTATKDSVVIMDCKKRNHYFATSDCKFIFFHFNGDQVQALYDYVTNAKTNCFQATEELKHLINQIFNLFKTRAFADKETTFSVLLYQLLIALTLIADPAPTDRSSLKQTPQMVTQALDYLDKHYAQKITIAALCKRIGVSPSLLSQNFRAYTDNSVHGYLTSVRILHVKGMLTTAPDLSIADIAEQCGFHDTSHLNKVFSTETGLTPSKFRKICF